MRCANELTEGNKIRLRDYIISGAKNYNSFLINKTFKIICEDGTNVDVRFFSSDFKHLTGLRSDLNENDFYNKCVHSSISVGNIDTLQKYNWSTLLRKCKRIENIHELIYESSGQTLLLEFLDTHTYIFPVAIRNDLIDTCIGFVSNSNKARSLRTAKSSTNFRESKKIIGIFAKPQESPIYSEMIYISDSSIVYENIRDNIDNFSDDICKILTSQGYKEKTEE